MARLNTYRVAWVLHGSCADADPQWHEVLALSIEDAAWLYVDTASPYERVSNEVAVIEWLKGDRALADREVRLIDVEHHGRPVLPKGTQVASAVGLRPRAVQRYWTGEVDMKLSTFARIVSALRLTGDECRSWLVELARRHDTYDRGEQ